MILLPTAVGLYRNRLRPWRWVRDTAYRVWYGSSVALLLTSFVASNIAPENSALFALFLVAHLVTLGVAHRALRVAEKKPKEEPLPSAEEGETTKGARANEDATPEANDAKANVVSRLFKAVSPVARTSHGKRGRSRFGDSLVDRSRRYLDFGNHRRGLGLRAAAPVEVRRRLGIPLLLRNERVEPLCGSSRGRVRASR